MKTAGTHDLAEMRAQIWKFLAAAREPALLEPGEELLPLDSANYALEVRGSRLTLQAWDRTRNFSRRLIAVTEATSARRQHEAPHRRQDVAEAVGRDDGRLTIHATARGTGDHQRRCLTHVVAQVVGRVRAPSSPWTAA